MKSPISLAAPYIHQPHPRLPQPRLEVDGRPVQDLLDSGSTVTLFWQAILVKTAKLVGTLMVSWKVRKLLILYDILL